MHLYDFFVLVFDRLGVFIHTFKKQLNKTVIATAAVEEKKAQTQHKIKEEKRSAYTCFCLFTLIFIFSECYSADDEVFLYFLFLFLPHLFFSLMLDVDFFSFFLWNLHTVALNL